MLKGCNLSKKHIENGHSCSQRRQSRRYSCKIFFFLCSFHQQWSLGRTTISWCARNTLLCLQTFPSSKFSCWQSPNANLQTSGRISAGWHRFENKGKQPDLVPESLLRQHFMLRPASPSTASTSGLASSPSSPPPLLSFGSTGRASKCYDPVVYVCMCVCRWKWTETAHIDEYLGEDGCQNICIFNSFFCPFYSGPPFHLGTFIWGLKKTDRKRQR